MFQFLKSLLGQRGNGYGLFSASSSAAPRAVTAAAPTEAVEASTPASADTASDYGLETVPSQRSFAFSGTAGAVAAVETSPLGLFGAGVSHSKGRLERVLLALKSITDKFPAELQPMLAQVPSPNVMVALSAETILEQLPTGRVEVTIGDLRQAAPVGIFLPETSRDQERVQLPLQEILLKLDPALLPRHTQRRIRVPMAMGGIFIKKPNGAKSTDDKPEVNKPLSPVALSIPVRESAARPAHPAPETASSVKTEALPISPEMQAFFGQRKPRQPLTEAVGSPAPPSSESFGSGLRLRNDPPPQSPAPSTAPAIQADPLVPPAPAPMAPAAPVAPHFTPPPFIPDGPTVAVPLAKISAGWPQGILQQIARLKPNISLAFPVAILGEALKSGKVVFRWEELRSWIVPPVRANVDSSLDNTLLELPLPVVAPLFIAAAGPLRAGRLPVAMNSNLPPSFTRARLRPIDDTPPTPPPARQRPVEDAPPPSKQDAEHGSGNVEKPPFSRLPITESSSLRTPPGTFVQRNEDLPSVLVDRACALKGVSGALVTLAEGLLVAAKIPPELQTETLAAFLPQVFSRVEQATDPMQIGELQSIMFTAGDRPWQIWKAGSLFFAAMGRPHELLPSAQLRVLASQLARQSKKDADAKIQTSGDPPLTYGTDQPINAGTSR